MLCVRMKYSVINLIYIILCQKNSEGYMHNDFNFSHETDDTLICEITDSFV